jgi:aldose 1-epimerase
VGGVGFVTASTLLRSRGHGEIVASDGQQSNGNSHTFPTGRQFQIEAGNQRLVVTEVGATLRSYQVAEREFLWGFKETELPSNSNGQLLLPWPGRCEGGAYTFQGVVHQLAITGVADRIAQHGLVRFMNWQLTRLDTSRLIFELLLHPQLGYPFTLSLRQEYELTSAGLVVTTSATNVGAAAAPYATGMHPYFTLGTTTIDDNILKIPARQYLPRTLSGAATAPMQVLDNTTLDLRARTRIGGALFTPAVSYGNLVRDDDGRSRTVLEHPSGSPTVTVWTDQTIDFLTLYTPPARLALAIEPCTAPSNALNHGLGLRTLLPGETARNSFGVHVTV